MRSVVRMVLLAGIWLLWSGHSEPLILGFGAASVLLVTWLARRMDAIDKQPSEFRLHPLRLASYVVWLLKEIAKSNLHVARVILDPDMPIQPRLMAIDASQRTELAQVIYANSITLTPGTITLDIRDGKLLVHALTRESADGLASGDMNRHLTALELEP